MKFETPGAGRAAVQELQDRLTITVPSGRNLFLPLFLGFWLCGWAIGEIAVISALISGGVTGEGGVFSLVWLGAWTIGGVFALSQFLWLVAGREVVEVSNDGLVVTRAVPGWRRRRAFAGAHIRNLRARALPTTAFGFAQSSLHGLWSGWNSGSVCFDFGHQTVGFGMDLDEAEAEHLTDRIDRFIGDDG